MKRIVLAILSMSAFLLSGGLRAQTDDDCGVQSIPYVETFENSSWTGNTLNCWTIIDNNSDGSTFQKATYGVGNSGCAAYKYHSSNAADDYLISPRINIDKAASLSFKVRAYNTSNAEKYSVLVSETGVAVTDFVIVKPEETITFAEYQTVTIDLSSYIGKQIYIAIKASSDANKFYLCIDDFMVISCGAPSGIKAERASAADYEITWNTSASKTEFSYKKTADESFTKVLLNENKYTLSTWEENTQYTVKLRAVCGEGDTSLYSDEFRFTTGYKCDVPSDMAIATQDNGYELTWKNFAAKTIVYYKKKTDAAYASIEVSGQSHLFTGLDAATPYVVQLRSLCGEGDTSQYTSELSFTTACATVTVPYLETFDADRWLTDKELLCWTIIDNNGDGKTWAKDATSGAEGSACAKYTYNYSSAADDYLISPRINLNKQATLNFKIKTSSSGTEKYSVLLSRAGNSIEDFSVVLQEEREIKQASFQTVGIDLSAYTEEQVYVAIRVSSDANQYNLYIDDFMVVSCGAPSGIKAERASAADYEITWTSAASQTEFSYKKTADESFTKVLLNENKYTLSTWEENTQYTVKLRAICGEGDTSLYSDEFRFTTGYNCETPSAMAVDKKENGYELSWKNFAEKTIVYYKKVNEADFASVETTGLSYLFTDLDAGALYNVKLRSLCGDNDTSAYSSEYSFTTECGLATIPYLETFDADRWITDAALLCWTIIDNNNDGKTWAKDATSGVESSACAKYTYSGSNPGDDYLISPQIDLSKSAALSFKIKTGSGKEKYSVLLSKSGTLVTDFTEVLQAETEISSSAYQTVDIDLSAYTGEKVYIAIKASSAANQYWLFVDDFMVVSCGAPTNLAVSDLTETSAKIGFTSSASNFMVAYKKNTESQWTELNASSNPIELSNLDPGYTYQVKVKAYCSDDDESLYSNEITFTTPCFAFEFPLLEDFSAPTIPLCWDSTQWFGNKGAWSVGENYTGTYILFEGGNNSWGKISTPDVDLTGVDLERLEMAMTYNFSNYETKGERLWISYSTDRGATWDTIRELDKNNAKEELTIKLGEYVQDASTIRMRLESIGKNSTGFSIRVYDFKIRHEQKCFPPTDLHIEGEILYNEATLAWSAPDSSKDGAIKNYTVEYGAIDLAEIQTVTAEDTIVTLGGLTKHTQYEAKVSTVCQTESSEPVKITWETPYSCLQVEDLKLGALLPTEAELSWSSQHEAFEVRYKTENDEDWTTVEDITTKNYTIQNLLPAANYTMQVRAVCASDDASLWDSVSVVMPDGILPVPYAENFENTVDSLPLWWRYKKLAGTRTDMQWVAKTDYVKEGKKALAYNSSGLSAGHIAIVSTPLLDFSYDAVYTVSFDIRRTTNYSSSKDQLKVFISKSPEDTLGARLLTSIYRHPDMEPVVTDKSADSWYHYSFDLTDMEGYKYVLLCGISAYGDWIYIDNFKVDALFETNIGIVKVEPIVPRADLGEESVSVVLNNTGLDDFSGNVELCFSVDGKDTVRESVSFTEEPLVSETDMFEYTFNAKADFSQIGEHKLNVWVEAQGDPAFDNAATIDVVHYAPLELPYHTFFCDSIAQERYIYVMNVNADEIAWARNSDSGMYLAPNADLAANDLFFTPGMSMPMGQYEIEVVCGTNEEGKTEKMRLDLVRALDTVEGIKVAEWNEINQTEQTFKSEIMLDEAGIYMLRFAAKSEADQGGINVFELKVKNTLSYIDLAEVICQGDTYPFGDRDLTQAGTYTDTVRHEDATDTIFTLVLSVNPSYEFTLDTAICAGESVEFGGKVYTESGEYKEEYLTVNGCDSIYTLKLTINPSYEFTLDTAICAGESVEFGGKVYTESGEYKEEYLTVNGCDSIYTLKLTVNVKAVAPVISGEEIEGRQQWKLTAVTEEPAVQWYRDDAQIEGADELVYVAEVAGIYHATAINSCGESEASNKIEVKISSANEDADLSAVPFVYPNPARDRVYVKASETIEYVLIYAPNGRMIKRVVGNRSGMLTLTVQELNAGIYVMQVVTANGMYNYKLIINE